MGILALTLNNTSLAETPQNTPPERSYNSQPVDSVYKVAVVSMILVGGGVALYAHNKESKKNKNSTTG
tara:strand:+ start:20517 stop:20720 length:204 start_codon:yes stop_codon:yes gene_type:complete